MDNLPDSYLCIRIPNNPSKQTPNSVLPQYQLHQGTERTPGSLTVYNNKLKSVSDFKYGHCTCGAACQACEGLGSVGWAWRPALVSAGHDRPDPASHGPDLGQFRAIFNCSDFNLRQ